MIRSDSGYERLVDILARDEFVLNRMRREEESQGKPWFINSASDVLAEQRCIGLAIAQGRFNDSILFDGVRENYSGRDFVPPEEEELLLDEMARQFISTPAFLWKFETLQLATSTELPNHIVGSHIMPFEAMYWAFHKTLLMETGDCVDGMFLVSRHNGDGVNVFYFGTEKGDKGPVCGFIHQGVASIFGKRYLELPEREKIYVKYLTFMTSKIAVCEESQAPRHVRKRDKQPWNKKVTTVLLRQYDKSPKLNRDATEAEKIEWAHRWLVRGHWRAQWYPSTQSHKVIWIDNYIKGPDEAPFCAKVYKVAR